MSYGNELVKRGGWLIPQSELFKVTERIMRAQADPHSAYPLIEDLLRQRFERERDENFWLELYNYDEPPSGWEAKDYLEFLEDNGIGLPEPDEDGDYDEDELRSIALESWFEYRTDQVAEWYRVDKCAADRLREMGQAVACAYGEWYWGRVGGGQYIFMDYEIEELCATWYAYYLDEFPFIRKAE